MVSNRENAPNKMSRTEVISALLGFVERTTVISDMHKQAGELAASFGRGRPFAHDFLESSLTDAIGAGASTVNDYFAQLGGISASWTDKASGEHMQGIIMGCQKFNPDTGVWDLVFRSPTYSGLIGATPQRLGEILLQSNPGISAISAE